MALNAILQVYRTDTAFIHMPEQYTFTYKPLPSSSEEEG